MKFNTKTIHGNQHPDKETGAVMPPIYQTSTFAQKSPGVHQGYEYSRAANPTRQALEDNLAAIENGVRGLAFSSGLAAIDCVMRMLQPGDEVITGDDLYGGTYRMFSKMYEPLGIKFHFVDMDDLENVKSNINDHTRLIWMETPTNPLMKIADIEKIAKIANQANVLLAVDNTFATPYIQRPLDLGADIVMHSATKYLGGHSDVVAGALVANSAELGEKLHFIQFAAGAILGPQDSYLVLRGIKTLALRMERHCENGEKIAEYLNEHPLVNKVFYPGLETNSYFNLAQKQMKGKYGGMVSFNFKSGNREDAVQFLERLTVFTLAESLGGVESLANHPATMTHASIPENVRHEIGITDDLVRLSVGVEDVIDLMDDLAQAFNF